MCVDFVDERTSSGAVRDIFSRCFPVDLCSHAAAAFEIATDRLITIFKTATAGRLHHAGSRTLERNIPVGRLGGHVRNEVRLERPVTRLEHDLTPRAACEKASVRALETGSRSYGERE